METDFLNSTSDDRVIRLSNLVSRLRVANPAAAEELYRIFSPGIRFLLFRGLGPDGVQDELHEVFLILLRAIQNGQLRDPERLEAFIHGVVQRRIARAIQVKVRRREKTDLPLFVEAPDPAPTPDQAFHRKETADLLRQVLASMPKRDREVLLRFYLKEQSKQQICAEMGLTETQFRLLKSRAKARFGIIGRQRTTAVVPQGSALSPRAGRDATREVPAPDYCFS